MFKSLSVFMVAMAVVITSAASVEIESHDASSVFVKQIAGCYKRAPAALLTRTGSPRILVVKDFATLAKLTEDLVLPIDYFITNPFPDGNHQVRGFAYGGRQRAAIFIEHTLGKDHPVYVCDVVLHELAHLYDYPLFNLSMAPRQSDSDNFAKAFKQDIAKIDKKHSEMPHNKHYMSSPREAFAEAVARTILLHPDMKGHKMHVTLFPNVMSYVRKLLIDDGIIRPDHKGDQKLVREVKAVAAKKRARTEQSPIGKKRAIHE